MFVAGIAAAVSVTFDLAMILAERTMTAGVCPRVASNELVKADDIGLFEHHAGSELP